MFKVRKGPYASLWGRTLVGLAHKLSPAHDEDISINSRTKGKLLKMQLQQIAFAFAHFCT